MYSYSIQENKLENIVIRKKEILSGTTYYFYYLASSFLEFLEFGMATTYSMYIVMLKELL
jgi:hypothetical protein